MQSPRPLSSLAKRLKGICLLSGFAAALAILSVMQNFGWAPVLWGVEALLLSVLTVSLGLWLRDWARLTQEVLTSIQQIAQGKELVAPEHSFVEAKFFFRSLSYLSQHIATHIQQERFLQESMQELQLTLKKQGEVQIRFQEALTHIRIPVVILDKRSIVLYFNHAAERILRQSEGEIQKVIGHFKVDTLLGQSMDVFRRWGPQIQVVGNMNSPHKSDLHVGGLVFNLITHALRAPDSRRVGFLLQFDQRTSELKFKEAFVGWVERTRQGDWKQPFELAADRTVLREMIGLLNSLWNDTYQQLSDLDQALTHLSKGVLFGLNATSEKGVMNKVQQDFLSLQANLLGNLVKMRETIDEMQGFNEQARNQIEQELLHVHEAFSALRERERHVAQQEACFQLWQAQQQTFQTAVEPTQGALESMNQEIERWSGTQTASVEEAQKTLQILDRIEEIAFRTHLLSLNASVEAAKVQHEDAAGFAVVTHEIRLLAERGTQAIKEVKELHTMMMTQLQACHTEVQAIQGILGQLTMQWKDLIMGVEKQGAALAQQTLASQQIKLFDQKIFEQTQELQHRIEIIRTALDHQKGRIKETQEVIKFYRLEDKPKVRLPASVVTLDTYRADHTQAHLELPIASTTQEPVAAVVEPKESAQ